MSVKYMAICSFEPTGKRTTATDHPAPEGLAAEFRFREDLWQEYRREAIRAGLTTTQATEYASALSPEMGLVKGVSGTVPFGRGWFYQSRIRLVRRTVNSGLIKLKRWEKSKTIGRTEVAGVPIFAPKFRPWNAGDKN